MSQPFMVKFVLVNFYKHNIPLNHLETRGNESTL